jgi:hypothetical protein
MPAGESPPTMRTFLFSNRYFPYPPGIVTRFGMGIFYIQQQCKTPIAKPQAIGCCPPGESKQR